MINRIDLNCDMGESFGVYTLGSDSDMLDYITSANIACGAHAGDPAVMNQTVRMAKEHGVRVGAHPGFPDLAGFGRRMMSVSPEDIYHMVVYQVGSLKAFCDVHHLRMQHVKPHGALYNKAAKEPFAAEAIACAVRDIDPQLVLYGLAGSELLSAGADAGLSVASEVFADRTYQKDGTLTPRSQSDALIEDTDTAIRQVEQMVQDGTVYSADGELIPVTADTVCIHGDGVQAVQFVKKLRDALKRRGIKLAPPDGSQADV